MNKFNGLQVFVSVAKLKSFSKAADACNLSRPSVTRIIAELESELKSPLFHRSTRSVALTTFGETMFEKAQLLLRDVDELFLASSNHSDTVAGHLRISSSSSSASFFLLDIVNEFLLTHPKVKIDLLIMEGQVDLLGNKVDIAFQSVGELNPSYIARRIATCTNKICATPCYLQRWGKPETPSDLIHHRIILNPYFGLQWHFEKNSDCIDIPVDGQFHCNNAFITLDAIKKDLGIGLLPSYAVDQDIQSGALIEVLSDWSKPRSEIAAITDNRHLSVLVKSFLDFAKNKLQSPKLNKHE